VATAATVGLGALAITAVVVVMQEGQAPDRHVSLVGWGSEATLQLREDGDGGILLAPGIRFLEPIEGAARVDVYRLDLRTREFTPTTTPAWNRAPGDIVNCERAGLTPSAGVSVESNELHIRGRVVPMGGEVHRARLSPSGRLLAVLTASGVSMPRTSLIPTLGGKGMVGWRYHQLAAMPSGEAKGARVALGFGVSDPSPCWSPNDEIIIYSDPAFTDVSLVVVPR
jgi:hypothetical protein